MILQVKMKDIRESRFYIELRYRILLSWRSADSCRRRKTVSSVCHLGGCSICFSLQTALLSAFSVHQEEFSKMMNGITGTVVSVIVLFTGFSYLYQVQSKF